MLEKKRTVNCLNGLFQKTQVTYWDGTVKSMGKGRGSGFKIVFNEKFL